MRPVDDSPLGVPLILPTELDSIALAEGLNSPGQIYIVRDQKSLPRGKTYNKALMPASDSVIGENSGHDASAPDLFAAGHAPC